MSLCVYLFVYIYVYVSIYVSMYVYMYAWMYVCVHAYICMYVHLQLENSFTALHQTWHAQSVRPEKIFQDGRFSGKVTWIRVPLRAVNVSRKEMMMEDGHQDQSCFHRRDYRNKWRNSEKLFCVRVVVKMVYIAWKQSTVENRSKTRIVYFSE